MTREEAAEIVLRGPAFNRCPSCGGSGFLHTHPGDDWADAESCDICIPEVDTKTGSGKVWNEEYKSACLFLGLELPVASWTNPRHISGPSEYSK
jgi:hypothetical protein